MQAKINEIPSHTLSEIRKISSKRCEGCWPGRKVADNSPLAQLKVELKGLILTSAQIKEYDEASLDFGPAAQDQLNKTLAIIRKYQPNAGLHTDYRNLLTNLDIEFSAMLNKAPQKSLFAVEDSEVTEARLYQGAEDFNL